MSRPGRQFKSPAHVLCAHRPHPLQHPRRMIALEPLHWESELVLLYIVLALTCSCILFNSLMIATASAFARVSSPVDEFRAASHLEDHQVESCRKLLSGVKWSWPAALLQAGALF